MNRRVARSVVLIVGATAVVMVLVRVAGALFAWQVMSGPQSAHFARLAWIELGLEVAVIASGAAAVWRVLWREREQQRSRARWDHLAEVGALASGLAHEMRNYLNAMHTHVALLRKMARSDAGACQKCDQRITRLDETTGSLEELLGDFLTFARPLSDRLEEIRVGELVGEVADFVGLDMEQAGVELHLEVDPHVAPVRADRAKLKRAILNLLVNARQAMPEGGTISVRVAATGDSVMIEIADTGCGVPEELRPRVFDSFFSTKSEGAGLGLAIVKRTIEDLSGSVVFESSVGRGTTFRIVLPSATRYSARAKEEARRPSAGVPRAGYDESGP
jgi:signal transduction histidine kinase